MIGAGGIYGTAEDTARFGSIFYNSSVLSEASIDTMSAPEYLNGFWHDDTQTTMSFGLGWDDVKPFPFTESGITALVKGGDTMQYHASLVVLPDNKKAAAVLSSGGSSMINQLFATRLLLNALKEDGIAVTETGALPQANPAETHPSEFSKAGFYTNQNEVIQISFDENGRLILDIAPDVAFSYYDDGSYRDEEGTSLFKLVKDEGHTYLFQKSYAALPWLATALLKCGNRVGQCNHLRQPVYQISRQPQNPEE